MSSVLLKTLQGCYLENFHMDTITKPEIIQPAKLKETISATELDWIFEQFHPQIKILSLDCFDTILWRKTATPMDVFYDLQQYPTFKALQFTALMRIRSESKARILKVLKDTSSEIELQDIYRACMPNLTEEQINQLEEEELAAEMEACYPLPAVVELMRKAHAKGIKIIIVSDTYLKQSQLKKLLQHTLPPDVMSSIDKIFCSSAFGKSKINGLFEHVLKEINYPPQSILHLGDNPSADLIGPREFNVNTLQLIHHDENINELLRMQAAAVNLMDPSIRQTRALKTPFRGILATAQLATNQPEQMIGYASMGPVMYAFARFICDEVADLKKQGKQPKVLFLMRDAHLPALICETILGHPLGKRIRISRFASLAASFRNQDDINHYLADVISSQRYADICRQLLLPEKVADPIIKATIKTKNHLHTFMQLIQQKNITRIIFKQSADYRTRLLRHIEKEIGLEKGDTLVFVDLGYSGTTQRLLEPILRDEMGIDVVGRYLLALSVPGWQSCRRGLLDPATTDERVMLTLITYIALLEQLCTSNEKSVMDYDEEGNAIYGESNLSIEQHNNLDRIQAECIRFAKDAERFYQTTQLSISVQTLRDAAISGLGRLLFLPTEIEIQYLQTFQFDLNLGTKDTFDLINQNKGLQGLRQRGLFSLFMEKNAKSLRTNTPAELRSAGLELALTMMAHHRFSLEFGMRDMNLRREKINAIIVRGKEIAQTTLEAQLTHDGYYALWIPVGTGNFQIGILFGQTYQWIQFESIEFIMAKHFLSFVESQFTEDAWSNVIFEKMVDKGGKLYECLSASSLMIVTPKQKTNDENYILRAVFRPIVTRS